MKSERFLDVHNLFEEIKQIEQANNNNKKLEKRRRIEDLFEQKKLQQEFDDFCYSEPGALA